MRATHHDRWIGRPDGDALQWRMTGSSAPDRPADRSRRAVLVTAIASAVGTAGCSWSGDDEGYDRSDHEMTFGLECVDPAAGRYVARLAWEWTNGEDGSTPRDKVFIYWDADTWDRVEDSEEAISGAVVYDGWRTDTDRRSHVVFLHYDTAADADREYAASYGLSAIGDVAPTNRSVFAAYVHRTQEGGPYYPDYSEGSEWTSEGGKWTRTAESSQTAAACPEEGT